MGLKVYVSTVSSNLEIKKNQQKIEMILSSKGYDVQYIDVAASEEAKQRMRDLSGNPKALPPQIFNEDQYCGDFEAFDNAIEDDNLEEFLKLK